MAEEKFELQMILRDHRTIVDALKQAADGATVLADETARQRQEVDALELSYRRLGQTIAKVNQAATGSSQVRPGNNFATSANAGARVAAASSPFGGGGGRAGGGLRIPSGPFSRVQRLRNLLNAPGLTPEQDADLRYQLYNAEQRVNKLTQGPTPQWKRVLQAISSTRFSVGANGSLGGFQPLIGRTLSALGISGPLGQIALIGTVVARAIKAFHDLTAALTEPTRRLTAFSSVAATGIGTASALSMLGMSGGDARGVLGRITSDPVAMGTAARLGVSAIPGPYGTLDAGKTTLKLIEALRKESGEQQQRDARILGLEGFGGLLKVSNAQFEMLKKSSDLTDRVMGRRAQTAAADFSAADSRLATSFHNFMEPVSTAFAHLFTDAENILSDGMDFFTRMKANSDQWLDQHAPGFAKWWRGDSGDQAQAQDEQTQTTKELVVAIRRLNHSMQLSERGQRALPDAVRGANFHRALQLQALPTGTL